MSEIDTDYLWLNQQRKPHRRRRLLPTVCIVTCTVVMLATAWLYTRPATDKAQPRAAADFVAVTPTTAQQQPAPDTAAVAGPNQLVLIQDITNPRPEQATQSQANLPSALNFEPGLRLALTSNLIYNTPSAADSTAAGSDDWIDVSIDKGDTLSSAFARYNLSYTDSLAIAKLPKFGKYFTTGLRVGDKFGVKADAQGHVLALKDSLGPARILKIEAGEEGYSARIHKIKLTKRIAYASGVISSSFYHDALAAGLSDNQVMELAGLFKWTIDFAYGIRAGDRFTVIYNELYKQGRKVGNGHILAAAFQTGNDQFRALRFTSPDDTTHYYRADGSSLKRAFVRVPVDYTRVSSPFTRARKHPILDNTVRAHEGTDFAAPMGTPVHAAGNGRIVFRGRNGGYGNMIAIDHGRSITTRYGHMSRFASSQAVGTRVKQGDVIGYVGSTGMSTGPHLHYEFRVNDEPKNPQTVDLPGAPPLPKKYMDKFKAHVKPLIAQLKTASATMLARNGHSGIGE